ncbi:Jag N-terminal domain-containing protein [bacterium]|nr:Jag N-terminal domain-containing protein [bacterium]
MNVQTHSHIEIEAPTVASAVEIALKQLHVYREQVEIEVLREEKKGLFGMKGESLAKIRATIVIENK